MLVRSAIETDSNAIAELHRDAFGSQEGEEIAQLVAGLQQDETAQPLLSLVAADGDRVVGHVLFSRVVPGRRNRDIPARILAPLAVSPRCQGRGIGAALVRHGLAQIEDMGVGLVFVLGDPHYYSRIGFVSAAGLGLNPPYPLPEEWFNAWMVLTFTAGIEQPAAGDSIQCSRTLAQPRYWQE